MSEQIKCPAKEPLHYAGVSQIGIRKHIYSCKALKKKDKETILYQCQYCLLYFFLSHEDLDDHVNLCSKSHTQKIQWDLKINTITIAPDPYLKVIDPKEACKNWEYFRDKKEKLKEKKRLSVLHSSNSSLNSQNEDLRCDSPTLQDSPLKTKKVKQNDLSPPRPLQSTQSKERSNEPVQEVSQEERERQDKLIKENEEKIRTSYLESLKTKMKVDDYQNIVVND